MDSEFPTLDEEFDLAHEDEYDALREIEEYEAKKRTVIQKVETLNEKPKEKDELNNLTPNIHEDLNILRCNIYNELNAPTSSKYHELCTPSTSKVNQCNDNVNTDASKKRSYDDLFGDITDIYDINAFADTVGHREKKPRWNQPQEIIKVVLDAREKFHEHSRGVSIQRTHIQTKKDTISLRVPRWNFIAVTRPRDAQRIYIRIKNNEQSETKTNTCSISNLLLVPYSQLKAEAEEIIVENVKRASCETLNCSTTEIGEEDDELWVDKYRPKSYVELLSDESVNRELLHWIKLWDKVVFNQNYVQSRKKKLNSTFKNRKFMTLSMKNEDTVEEVDSKGFPIQRLVLLTGPPGLGKTTLAHLAAKHAGYNVVEINASDERSPDAFRLVLLASTQMKAVMGSDRRPNCLILDEIDGAPAASIELLLKFVEGKLVSMDKKGKAKGAKQSNICYRPVICICNELYTPSLRPLRAVARIIPVPEVSTIRLADRLMEISDRENLKVNPNALLRLAEISGCDIRSCLGALQYMGGLKLGDNISFALKDTRKGLFDSWRQILTIPMNKSGILPIPERVRLILKTVQKGESDKLMQGIFHNYPDICSDKLNYITVCLQWFQIFDEISTLVANLQVWSVMPYLNYAFVTWHLYFARAKNVKLTYPSTSYEVYQKHARNIGILATVQRSSGRNNVVLTVDIAPFLPDLLSPRLRTVSGHLHSAKEKEDISRLVNVLLDFGLTYTQEKKIDGTYDYKLDPDILGIGVFPGCKQRRTSLYAVKQIIVQELEAERVRRAANMIKSTISTKNKDEVGSNENITAESAVLDIVDKAHNKSNIPNLTERSKKIDKEPNEIKYKDFFGRIITVNQSKQMPDTESARSRHFLTKNGVWYKYKEGYSNAVRRNVLIEDLL